jgi:hypothetical protein
MGMAQTIENEIRQTPAKLRKAGHRGFVLRYPSDLADAMNFKGGERFELYVNHKGEIFARPFATPVQESGA